jgi:hypothetical protein
MDGKTLQTWGLPCNPSVSCKLYSTRPLENFQTKEIYVDVKQGVQSRQYAFFLYNTLRLKHGTYIRVQNYTVVRVNHTNFHTKWPFTEVSTPWLVKSPRGLSTGGDVSDGEARALSTRWMFRATTRWRLAAGAVETGAMGRRSWKMMGKLSLNTHTYIYIKLMILYIYKNS